MKIEMRWKEHLLYRQGVVELVPTEWVWRYCGPDVSLMATLRGHTPVDLDTLWKNIVDNGLHSPLIMRVGLKNKKMRLEAGNHRIQLFYKHGVDMIPATVQVRDECGPHLDDVMTYASHNFDATDELMISETYQEYMKPSMVFKSLAK